MAIVNLYEETAEKSSYEVALLQCMMKAPKTYQAIMGYLINDSFKYDVFVLPKPEAYGQMLTDGDTSGMGAGDALRYYTKKTGSKVVTRPAVFWNPYYHFEYFSDFIGITQNSAGTIQRHDYKNTKGYISGKDKKLFSYYPVIQLSRVRLPPEITLLHELGHVKQFYEGGGLVPWKGRLQNVDQIEADNLKDHENPLTDEYGLPSRIFYKSSRENFRELITETNRRDKKYGGDVTSFRACDHADRGKDSSFLSQQSKHMEMTISQPVRRSSVKLERDYIEYPKLIKKSWLLNLKLGYDPIGAGIVLK